MLTTYKAKLKDGKLEWTDEVPPIVKSVETQVLVTLLPTKNGSIDKAERGRRMKEALDALAAMDGIKSISDPIAWQREMREDRPLPSREE
ncbi:MAG: hypothetical protein HY043_18705 [Verrucomicrobia bacterium]|nr:hypothetical protein [Verrucomicrobiota bacterium]